MPTYVDSDQYDGCRALDRPARIDIRPMDSMAPEPFGERKYLGVDRLPVPGASPGVS